MLSGLFQAICQVGIFMICAQTIVHFKPNGSYEKYLKMLVSIMLLIQIFLPIAKLFSGEAGVNIEERVTWFEQSLEEATKKAARSAFQSEDMLEKMTLKEVQGKLEEQTKEQGGETAKMGDGVEDSGSAAVNDTSVSEDLGNKNADLKVEKIQVKVGQADEAEFE